MYIKKANQEDNKYLIVCDLDGTLLNSSSELSMRTIHTVKTLVEMGNIFCIATGRTVAGAIRYYRQLGLDTLMSNLDGSMISNPSDSKFIPLNFTFNKNILFNIFSSKKIIDKIELAIVETHGECIFINNKNTKPDLKRNQELLQFLGVRQTKDGSYSSEINFNGTIADVKDDLYSLLFLLKDDHDLDEIANRIKDVAGTLSVTNWELNDHRGIVVSISSVFASKLTALKFFSSYYGIKLENCIVFGDSNNDVPMLQKAGYSFAMKNANVSAKLAAKYIARITNDQDGVALELEKLFYLNECDIE